MTSPPAIAKSSGAALPTKASIAASIAAVLSGEPASPGGGSQVMRPRQG